MAAVRTTRAALPIMLAAGKGAIVNISSVNAFLPDPFVMDYSAAKAALANFSKSLSKEVGPRGIRVNSISPGPVATDLWLSDHGVAVTVSRATGAKPEDVMHQEEHQTVTGRFSRPDEVADLVLILASDRTANVTGADSTIDGGLIPTLYAGQTLKLAGKLAEASGAWDLTVMCSIIPTISIGIDGRAMPCLRWSQRNDSVEP